MAYKPIFAKPYEDGWKDLPIEETGITADILNMYDATFEAMETQLKKQLKYLMIMGLFQQQIFQ